jgi:flagellar basal-body rod protein FlgG
MVNGAASSVLLPDGTTAYTRDGSFQRDNNGQMVTSEGFVLQPAITIPITAQSITVARDGTVSVMPAPTAPPPPRSAACNWPPSSTRPAGIEGREPVRGNHRLGRAAANTPGTNGAGTILQGYVETSNVNVVEEMVNMIQTQRAYEINSKAITTSDQMLQTVADVRTRS